jgi:hypothetical protein
MLTFDLEQIRAAAEEVFDRRHRGSMSLAQFRLGFYEGADFMRRSQRITELEARHGKAGQDTDGLCQMRD